MKTLLLMRHAKSDWEDRDVADHDRALSARGLKAAPRMGGWMGDQGLVPSHVLCSTARRAHHTAQLVCEALEIGKPDVRADLYLPTVDAMLAELVSAQGNCVLLVAHNPGCEVFIEQITSGFESMPTAAVAVIEFDVDDWSDVLVGRSGSLKQVQRPKMLG